MRVVRGLAAPWHRAEALVALENLPVQRAPHFQCGLPDLDEVLGDPRQAFAGGDPSPRGLAGGGKRQRDHRRDAPRSPDLELAPRAHPRLFAMLQLPAERDAGKALGAIDPFADRVLVRVSRDEPSLLVGDAPALHRLAEPRDFVEPPLECRALRDRSHAHPDALGAVMFEGGEAEAPPAVRRAEEHREVAEDLVPPLTESGEPA